MIHHLVEYHLLDQIARTDNLREEHNSKAVVTKAILMTSCDVVRTRECSPLTVNLMNWRRGGTP